MLCLVSSSFSCVVLSCPLSSSHVLYRPLVSCIIMSCWFSSSLRVLTLLPAPSLLLFLLLTLLWCSGLRFCNVWNECRCRPSAGQTKRYNRRRTKDRGAFFKKSILPTLHLAFVSSTVACSSISLLFTFCLFLWTYRNICMMLDGDVWCGFVVLHAGGGVINSN